MSFPREPCTAAGVRIGMARLLGLVLGAILATIRFGPPEANAPQPISATEALSGQIERLIEPQARAELMMPNGLRGCLEIKPL